MSLSEHTAEEKIYIVQQIENGFIGVEQAARAFGVSKTTLAKWRMRYRLEGYEAFQNKRRSYPAELKHQAVMDYLYGGLSQYQIIEKYRIANKSQLDRWIKKYNGHSVKTYSRGPRAMTKGRKTTLQERMEIVLYCLNHNRNFNETAERFQVSYQQVYGWVRKYEAGGQEALRDGRGRTKTSEELTEADQQKLAMKKLEYENERLRAENAFLKKLQELERRRR